MAVEAPSGIRGSASSPGTTTRTFFCADARSRRGGFDEAYSRPGGLRCPRAHAGFVFRAPCGSRSPLSGIQISGYLLQAESMGSPYRTVERLPAFPTLTRVLRYLGGRLLPPLIRLPVLLALRVLLPIIRTVAQQQQQANHSMVACSRGVAQRLMECEARVRDQNDRLVALEESKRQ